MGIDDRALACLMDHRWSGNDIELADVLLRAALNAQGTRVTLEDLEDTGFIADPLDGPAHRGDDDDDDGMPRMPIPRRRGRSAAS